MNRTSKIVVVVGPTASGKSDFAVELALKNNGEIISADSRQLYKGLDIGTGKITEDEMKGVRHHMLSVYDLDEEVSVARYARDTTPILEDIINRGKTPIICGGTGQYIDALIFDTTIPKVPPNRELRNELEKKSTDMLYEDLVKKDPARAKAIDKHNRVRLIRALEIITTLGKVPQQNTPKLRFPITLYLMKPSRDLLRKRITTRLEKRLLIGMIDEVKGIIQKGYTSQTVKKFGLEYVSISKYLEGTITQEAMKQEIITKSMQYAKRQETWNKRYLPFANIITVQK